MPKKLSEEKEKEIVELRGYGLTYKEIAEKTGVTSQTICNCLRRIRRSNTEAPTIPRFLGKNDNTGAHGVGPDGDLCYQRIEPGTFKTPSVLEREKNEPTPIVEKGATFDESLPVKESLLFELADTLALCWIKYRRA